MVVEGTLELQKGTGPRMIERRLEAFLSGESTP
jgi:flagellar motor component MotA